MPEPEQNPKSPNEERTVAIVVLGMAGTGKTTFVKVILKTIS